MATLFKNFSYPLIIFFGVPLAAAGGFNCLPLINIFVAPQGFDVLTMLDFIILIGTVVNNALYNRFVRAETITSRPRPHQNPADLHVCCHQPFGHQ